MANALSPTSAAQGAGSKTKVKAIRAAIACLPLLSIFFALLVGAIIIYASGVDPLAAYAVMIKGSVGSIQTLSQTLKDFTPLVFCAFAFVFAIQAGVFNMGAEGQFCFGAMAAVLVGIYVKGLPPFLVLVLAFAAAFAAGALWGSVASVLRITLGVSEIIVTIMQGYIATLFIGYLVDVPFKQAGTMISQTPPIPDELKLPFVIPGTRLHAGIYLAVAAILAVYVILWRTSLGYKLRMAGFNSDASRFSGRNNKMLIFVAMVISAGIAGVGGAAEALGNLYQLTPGFSPGYGFEAIGAAVLGKSKPMGTTLACLLFAAIRIGAGAMQRGLGVPYPLVGVIRGLIIIFMIISTYVQRRLETAVSRRY